MTTDHTPSRGRYTAGCRCAGCTAANRSYENKRTRLSAYGRPTTDLVDAEPVREHAQRLLNSGMGTAAIANAAGVRRTTVLALLRGVPTRPPTARLRPATARALLSVDPLLRDHALVDASGTRRRLRALVACGWSQARLAGLVGLTSSNLGRVVGGIGQVLAETERRVRRVYDELWDVAPPEGTRWERAAAQRARRHAAAQGWPPPAAWDDEWLDLPEDGLADRLAREAAAMDSAETDRCYRAKLAGDISPLVLAGAAEWLKRNRRRNRAYRERNRAA